jgi:16S rRNA pseudouridine516 synthase
LETNRKRQAILFDFDGTLVDSLPTWKKVDEIFFERKGLVFEESKIDFSGLSFSEAAVHTKKVLNLSESTDEIMEEWIEISARLYETDVNLKPYVREFVSAAKHNGFLTAIGTSNNQEIVQPILRKFGMLEQFDKILTCCEAGKGKPSPDVYLHLAEQLQVAPQACVIFEDTLEGVQAGKNAGMYVYAVEEPFNASQRTEIMQTADCMIEGFGYFKNNFHNLSGIL